MRGMTPDLYKLRESLPTLGPIVERLELELVDDPSWAEPSDTSYLSEADRENPDVAANVEAMTETNKLISWFGRDAEGYLGLWRGPSDRALHESPVVRLDSEGQYSIVAATIADYLAIAMPEDEFANTRETLTRAGFKVGFNPDAIWGALDGFDDDPNAYRNELYEQNRVKRGLPRSDEEAQDEAGEDDAHEAGNGAAAPMEAAVSEVVSGEVWVPDAAADARSTDEDASAVEVADTGEDEDEDEEEELPATRLAQPPAAKQPKKVAQKKPAVKAKAKKAPPPAKKPAKKAAAKPAAKPAAKKAGAKKPAPKKPATPVKKAATKKPTKGKAKRR